MSAAPLWRCATCGRGNHNYLMGCAGCGAAPLDLCRGTHTIVAHAERPRCAACNQPVPMYLVEPVHQNHQPKYRIGPHRAQPVAEVLADSEWIVDVAEGHPMHPSRDWGEIQFGFNPEYDDDWCCELCGRVNGKWMGYCRQCREIRNTTPRLADSEWIANDGGWSA